MGQGPLAVRRGAACTAAGAGGGRGIPSVLHVQRWCVPLTQRSWHAWPCLGTQIGEAPHTLTGSLFTTQPSYLHGA